MIDAAVAINRGVVVPCAQQSVAMRCGVLLLLLLSRVEVGAPACCRCLTTRSMLRAN